MPLQAENPERSGCISSKAQVTRPFCAQQFFSFQNQNTAVSVKDLKDYSNTDNK